MQNANSYPPITLNNMATGENLLFLVNGVYKKNKPKGKWMHYKIKWNVETLRRFDEFENILINRHSFIIYFYYLTWRYYFFPICNVRIPPLSQQHF